MQAYPATVFPWGVGAPSSSVLTPGLAGEFSQAPAQQIGGVWKLHSDREGLRALEAERRGCSPVCATSYNPWV